MKPFIALAVMLSVAPGVSSAGSYDYSPTWDIPKPGVPQNPPAQSPLANRPNYVDGKIYNKTKMPREGNAKVLPIVEDNAVVAHALDDGATALPGRSDGSEFPDWRLFSRDGYRVTLRGMLGMTAVDLEYSIVFLYSGQYISGAQAMLPPNFAFKIGRGYQVVMYCEFPDDKIVNVWTPEQPLAAMEMIVHTVVTSAKGTFKQSTPFRLYGNGRIDEGQPSLQNIE